MADDIYNFDKDFDPVEFRNVMRRFRDEAREDAMKKHPAGKTTTKSTTKNRLSNEANDLAVFRFLFVVIPLALLLTGIAVVPAIEAIFSTEIGYWTAFFLLMTIRWLTLQPRNNLFLWKVREQGSR